MDQSNQFLKQNVALVTGGTRGIGKGIAKKFLENGYKVIICARSKPQQVLFPSYEKNYEFIPCDISKSQSRTKLIQETMKKFRRLDILVNNAGIAPPQRLDILETTQESYDLVMNVNLKGPFFLTQKAVKEMLRLKDEAKIEQYNPKIINISSMSAYTSSPSRGEYCLSKAGMSMMTKLFADRLSEYGIPVFEIRPGIIKTSMTKPVEEKYDKKIAEGLLPIKRWGYPEDIGKTCYAIAEDMIPYATGEVINIDGGFHLRRL